MLDVVSTRRFLVDLARGLREDNAFTGAAALGFYFTLAIFPALILVMTVIPYLPVERIDQVLMETLGRAVPAQASGVLERVVSEVTGNRRGGLLSFSLLATLWAASSGMYAIMKQLDITYDAPEKRGLARGRALALVLSVVFVLLVAGAGCLVALGDWIERWLGLDSLALALFTILRWALILLALLLAFAVVYCYAPNVDHRFRFITSGGVAGVALLALASLGFSFYVSNFANYTATYGSIGAVIVLMLWLYIAGLVILVGSKVNSLLEHGNSKQV